MKINQFCDEKKRKSRFWYVDLAQKLHYNSEIFSLYKRDAAGFSILGGLAVMWWAEIYI